LQENECHPFDFLKIPTRFFMGPRTPAAQKDELPRSGLDEQLKMSHPLIKLSQLMNWKEIERSFGAYFASVNGGVKGSQDRHSRRRLA
jgi:hypothetical protein